MTSPDFFLREHHRLTRRWFLRLGAAAAAAWPALLRGDDLSPECAKACGEALAGLEYLTPPAKFGDVSRGNPIPHTLPDAKRKEVGLTLETWKLEVLADPATDAVVENSLKLD